MTGPMTSRSTARRDIVSAVPQDVGHASQRYTKRKPPLALALELRLARSTGVRWRVPRQRGYGRDVAAIESSSLSNGSPSIAMSDTRVSLLAVPRRRVGSVLGDPNASRWGGVAVWRTAQEVRPP